MINLKFNSPPNGIVLQNPDLKFLEILILYGESLYWNSGAGQASIDFTNGEKESLLILTFDIDYGFQVEIKYMKEPYYVSLGNGDFKHTVSPYVGGDPWLLPTRFFISREETWEAVEHFCETGERLEEITWGKLKNQKWDYGRS